MDKHLSDQPAHQPDNLNDPEDCMPTKPKALILTNNSPSMEEKVSNQIETSPTLERKRAKYTVEDVRQLCGGISRSTVMNEIRRKRGACYRARRALRFSEEHITKYLERVEQEVK